MCASFVVHGYMHVCVLLCFWVSKCVCVCMHVCVLCWCVCGWGGEHVHERERGRKSNSLMALYTQGTCVIGVLGCAALVGVDSCEWGVFVGAVRAFGGCMSMNNGGCVCVCVCVCVCMCA